MNTLVKRGALCKKGLPSREAKPLTTSNNAESNDSDLTYADTLPGAQYLLEDLALARKAHNELTGESKRQGEASPANLDFSVADFLEAYAQAIEDEAPWRDALETATTPIARQKLLDVLDYFNDPHSSLRDWPTSGLYTLAMFVDIKVASGILAVTEERLEQALQQREPKKSWAWWQAFGLAIRAGAPSREVAYEFGVHKNTVLKWRRVLTGETSPGRKAA
jgi:hypothetical protein